MCYLKERCLFSESCIPYCSGLGQKRDGRDVRIVLQQQSPCSLPFPSLLAPLQPSLCLPYFYPFFFPHPQSPVLPFFRPLCPSSPLKFLRHPYVSQVSVTVTKCLRISTHQRSVRPSLFGFIVSGPVLRLNQNGVHMWNRDSHFVAVRKGWGRTEERRRKVRGERSCTTGSKMLSSRTHPSDLLLPTRPHALRFPPPPDTSSADVHISST